MMIGDMVCRALVLCGGPDKIYREEMRIKRFVFDMKLVCRMFTQGKEYRVIDGIPEDATFRGFGHDIARNRIYAFLEHESFEDSEGGIPLDGDIAIEDLGRKIIN